MKHLLSRKHQNDSKMVVNDSNLMPKNALPFICECGKSYKYDSGYYRHKKNAKKMPKMPMKVGI